MTKIIENWAQVLTRADEDKERFVAWLADRGGIAFCVRERQFFQHHTAEWIYTPSEIRQLLAEFFDEESWLDPVKRPEGTNQTLKGDGVVIALMDLRSAFEALPEQGQAIVMRAYGAGEALSPTDRKRLQRTVDRMAAFLNRHVSETFDHSSHEGPGSRVVMSNAQARAATADTY